MTSKKRLRFKETCLPLVVSFLRPSLSFCWDPHLKKWQEMPSFSFIPPCPVLPDLSPKILAGNKGLIVAKNYFENYFIVCNPMTTLYKKLPPMLGSLNPRVVHIRTDIQAKSYCIYAISFKDDTVWGGWKKLDPSMKDLDNNFSRVEKYESATCSWKLLPSNKPKSMLANHMRDFLFLPLCIRSVFHDDVIYCVCQKVVGDIECCMLGYNIKQCAWKGPFEVHLKLGWFPEIVSCGIHLFLLGFHPELFAQVFCIYKFDKKLGESKLEAEAPQDVIHNITEWNNFKAVAFGDNICMVSSDYQRGVIYNVVDKSWGQWNDPSSLFWPRNEELFPFAPKAGSTHFIAHTL